jgi:hypothetical protein
MGFLRFFKIALVHGPLTRQAFPRIYGKLMQILHQEATMNHSLKPWNTFGIDRSAKAIVRAETEQQLLDAGKMPPQSASHADPW